MIANVLDGEECLTIKIVNKSSSPDIPECGKMSSEVIGLPRPRPLRHCLLRRSLLLTLLQSLLVCVLILRALLTVDAVPISIGYLKPELSITVDMAAVEIAGVADEQDVLVVS